MGHPVGLLTTQVGQGGVVSSQSVRCPIGLAMADEEEVHGIEDRVLRSARQYDGVVANPELVAHLKTHSVRTDGPFTLRSGALSSWYLDARQTTFDGQGARAVAAAVLEVIEPEVVAVGGMTMGADPIAVATAVLSAEGDRAMRAFSIRKAAKDHGTGGRLVGPVGRADRVAILEDTTTTGGAAAEAVEVAVSEGLIVVQVVTLVDRSGGAAAARFSDLGIPFRALVAPDDLGILE